jgi:DNA recombination protein RmuC
MPDIWSYVVPAAMVVVAVFIVAALLRQGSTTELRAESARAAAALAARLEALAASGAEFERSLRQDLAIARTEQLAAAQAARSDLTATLFQLTQTNEQRLDAIRQAVEQRLDVVRSENAQKLEQIRATVDEKLQTTLDQRLGASFKQVSDRLEQVHKGLGEMQALAVGVGDLKRVLTNVKTRGTWGEVQLATLLAEVLTPQQYATNVETVPGSDRRVEFAIRLPGRGADGVPCWLPVDAKFPLDDWQRLRDALERADAPAADVARKALAEFLRLQAKTIHDLYVEPPYTTDFAILFVPTEGLYAEMMSRPGFAEALQRDFRVTLCGPTNFLALLNSLQMGFRTIAIERRSSEVWKVLGAVKSEFAKFGEVLAKTKERIDKARRGAGARGVRSRAIARELRNVEALPEPDAARLIGVPPEADNVEPMDSDEESAVDELRDIG